MLDHRVGRRKSVKRVEAVESIIKRRGSAVHAIQIRPRGPKVGASRIPRSASARLAGELADPAGYSESDSGSGRLCTERSTVRGRTGESETAQDGDEIVRNDDRSAKCELRREAEGGPPLRHRFEVGADTIRLGRLITVRVQGTVNSRHPTGHPSRSAELSSCRRSAGSRCPTDNWSRTRP